MLIFAVLIGGYGRGKPLKPYRARLIAHRP
jgi:hypothetical protein